MGPQRSGKKSSPRFQKSRISRRMSGFRHNMGPYYMVTRSGVMSCCIPCIGARRAPGGLDIMSSTTTHADDKTDVHTIRPSVATKASMAVVKARAEEESKEPNVEKPKVSLSIGPDRVRRIAQYELGRTLGTGMSGKVKLGTHQYSGRLVAMKVVDKRATRKSIVIALKKEVKALKMLDHPNIVRLEWVNTDVQYPRKYGGTFDAVVLGLEYVEGGALCEYMVEQGPFRPGVIKTLFHQIVSALAFCHSKGIFHRDIKPSNILVDKHCRIKLADFGLAALSDDQGVTLATKCGTLAYMAPEIHAKRPYNGAKADVWSTGVVLFNLCTFASPFNMAKKGDWYWDRIICGKWEVYWRAVRRSFPLLQEGATDLMQRCMSYHPNQRPTIDEVCSNAWLNEGQATQEEVEQALKARKEASKERKAEEKQKALRRKGGARAEKGEYNPFDRKMKVSRASVCEQEDEEVAPSTPELSECMWEGQPTADGPFDFYSCVSGEETFSRLVAGLCRVGAVVEKSPRCPLTVRVSLPASEGVEMAAKMEVFEFAGPVTLVSVRVRGAAIITFNERVYRPLRTELRDIVAGAEEEQQGGGLLPVGEKEGVEVQGASDAMKERGGSPEMDGEDDMPPVLIGGSQHESILADYGERTGMI